MLNALGVGALVLGGAYLLLLFWPVRQRWARTIPTSTWKGVFGTMIGADLFFLLFGLILASTPLMLAGILFGIAAIVAYDGHLSAESYQRQWGKHREDVHLPA